MNTIPADIFRHIFTLIPRAFKYRSVCKEWKSKLSERMFIYLWEKRWIKSSDHSQWLEFDEPILRKGWFDKTLNMGNNHVTIPYNGYHFGDSYSCGYYENGILKHRFTVNAQWIQSGNTYFRMNWQEQELETVFDGRPCFYNDGFHIIKNQSWQRVTKSGKSKLNQCSKKQHANFLRIFNSGIIQHLIQAYIHFRL